MSAGDRETGGEDQMKAVAGFLQTLQAQETAVSPVECLSEFGRRNGESRSQHHWRASWRGAQARASRDAGQVTRLRGDDCRERATSITLPGRPPFGFASLPDGRACQATNWLCQPSCAYVPVCGKMSA